MSRKSSGRCAYPVTSAQYRLGDQAPARAASVTGMTGDTDPADSHELPGGMMNAGAVVRRGEVVERPAPPNVRALHAYLQALRRRGFDAAPVPVGVRADGREQLRFIPGRSGAC